MGLPSLKGNVEGLSYCKCNGLSLEEGGERKRKREREREGEGEREREREREKLDSCFHMNT